MYRYLFPLILLITLFLGDVSAKDVNKSNSGEAGFLSSTVAKNVTGNNPENKDTAPANNIYSSYLKMFSSLLILLALILSISYYLKKYLLKDGVGFGKNRMIKVLSTSYIGPKKTIALVHVANEVLVVGITNNNISMLTKFENVKADEILESYVKGK